MEDEPQRLLRYSAAMPGRDNRGRKARSPRTPARPLWGDQPDEQADGIWDRKVPVSLPDANGKRLTCRKKRDLGHRNSERERRRRNRCVGGSDAADPYPTSKLYRARRGTGDTLTARQEGTQTANPTAPTVLARERTYRPFLAPRSL